MTPSRWLPELKILADIREIHVRRIRRRAIGMLPLYLRRQGLYFRTHRRFFPKNPETFSEKVQWRILNDRRALIAVGGDKLAMKQYVADLSLNIEIPQTIWHGTDLRSVGGTDWACDWVLKPITGSGYAAFGSGSLFDSGLDFEQVDSWRVDDAYDVYGEWHYSQARPGYLLEERIPTADGASPDDYRIFVFDGQVRLIQVDTPRVAKVQRRFYTRDWVPLEVRQGDAELAEPMERPASLERMIELAERIGAAYDFIRVDLYDANGTIWFGELTPCPTGGLAPYMPPEFDRKLGQFWIICS